MLRIVDRLVLKDFGGPLVFGTGMFAMLTITTVVLQEALKFVTRYNLPPAYLLKLIGLAAPELIVLSIPMGVLLATLLGTARLNNDHEITAMRAAGYNLYRIMTPLLISGAILAVVTYFGWERLVPACKQELKTFKNNVLLNKTGKTQQERAVIPIRQGDSLRWVLIADEIDGGSLFKVHLLYFDPRDMDKDFAVRADKAVWQGNSWTFYNMRQVRVQPSESGDDRVIVQAAKAVLPDFNINPRSINLRAMTPEDLSASQLSHVIREMTQAGAAPEDREVLDYQTRLYFKYSIPLTPLFFIAIAFPLAILPQRTTSGAGMGLALLIVLAYYVLFSIFQKFGASGVVPPMTAAWTPNAILLATGVGLMESRQRR